MPAQVTIPSEIIDAYYEKGIKAYRLLTGGEINTTFLVTDFDSKKTILQRLNHGVRKSLAADYETVSSWLQKAGWEMAATLKTGENAMYASDNTGELWRSYVYIESDAGSDLEGDAKASITVGGLLGRLHRSLAGSPYQPHATPGYYRDAHACANRLEPLLARISIRDSSDLAQKMINHARKTAIEDSMPTQLIHGDPRIANVLFRGDKPLTFIDWDGCVKANPLVDVGDLVQSTAGEIMFRGQNSFSLSDIYKLLEEYHKKSRTALPLEIFINQAISAGRHIALALGMRHLTDSVEDYYFTWDPSRYSSRLEFNTSRAKEQWQVYKALSAEP